SFPTSHSSGGSTTPSPQVVHAEQNRSSHCCSGPQPFGGAVGAHTPGAVTSPSPKKGGVQKKQSKHTRPSGQPLGVALWSHVSELGDRWPSPHSGTNSHVQSGRQNSASPQPLGTA